MKIIQADLSSPKDAQAIVDLVSAYACDPMGGGQPLSAFAKENLAKELAKRPNCAVFLAYEEDTPAGLVICFEVFSTFQCKPILNIHDVVVLEAFRGRGVSRALFEEVEHFARANGCCKLTLEVLEGNAVARQAYQSFGFHPYELDPQMGKALFFEKMLEIQN